MQFLAETRQSDGITKSSMLLLMCARDFFFVLFGLLVGSYSAVAASEPSSISLIRSCTSSRYMLGSSHFGYRSMCTLSPAGVELSIGSCIAVFALGSP